LADLGPQCSCHLSALWTLGSCATAWALHHIVFILTAITVTPSSPTAARGRRELLLSRIQPNTYFDNTLFFQLDMCQFPIVCGCKPVQQARSPQSRHIHFLFSVLRCGMPPQWPLRSLCHVHHHRIGLRIVFDN